MNEDDKRNRKFQYDLTKAQVDFEFWFALSFGVLAIGYALLSYYKDNLLARALMREYSSAYCENRKLWQATRSMVSTLRGQDIRKARDRLGITCKIYV